jgi:endonuclease-3 related protein
MKSAVNGLLDRGCGWTRSSMGRSALALGSMPRQSTKSPGPRPSRADLLLVYRRLLRAQGPAGWWPGQTAFEVCLGAILTQNTAWSNVEKAILALRRRGLLAYGPLARLRPSRLARLIRPSGYFNVKARRIGAFLRFLGERYAGDVTRMAGRDPWALREELLGVKGIGRETADSMVLYAAGGALFVVDAYTRRIFARLGWVRGDEPYDEIQALFMDRLPQDVGLYNDYHAQIVILGKDHCRPRPRCGNCPLDRMCEKRGVTAGETAPGRRDGTLAAARSLERPRRAC